MYRRQMEQGFKPTTAWSDDLYQWVHEADIVRGLRQALEEWLIVVESNDEEGFTTLMRNCHTYLDDANSEGTTP